MIESGVQKKLEVKLGMGEYFEVIKSEVKKMMKVRTYFGLQVQSPQSTNTPSHPPPPAITPRTGTCHGKL